MQVNPLKSDTKVRQAFDAPASADTARTAESAAASGATSSSQASVHTTTPELLQLLGLVRRTPEVRTEVVKEITRRLETNELDTPLAAEQTAKAIVEGLIL